MFEVAVREEDVRGFAAELERGRDEFFGRSFGNGKTDFCSACECQFAEALVIEHVLTGFRAGARDDIEDAWRQDILDEIGKVQHGKRGCL